MNIIANTAIASVPKSPSLFWHLLKIFESLELDERFFEDSAWQVTGPLLLTEVFANRTFWTNNSIILPSRTFYPVHWADLDKRLISEKLLMAYSRCKRSFTFHHWQGERGAGSPAFAIVLVLCVIFFIGAFYVFFATKLKNHHQVRMQLRPESLSMFNHIKK